MSLPPLPHLNALATAVPSHDIHQAFIDWATPRLTDDRVRALFARMASRSGIDHRWSVLPPTKSGGSPVAAGGFYDVPGLPPTSTRMTAYAEHAPELALQAIALIDHGAIARLGVAAFLQDDALVVRGQLLPLIFGRLLRLPQRHLQGSDLAPGLAA